MKGLLEFSTPISNEGFANIRIERGDGPITIRHLRNTIKLIQLVIEQWDDIGHTEQSVENASVAVAGTSEPPQDSK